MEQVTSATKNLAEAERCKLKQLEVQNTTGYFGSYEKDSLEQSTPISEPLAKRRRLEISQVDQSSKQVTNGGETIDSSEQINSLRKAVEDAFHNTISIKMDYKRTGKSDINLWYDSLKSELRSNDLLDVIDESITPPIILSESTTNKRQNIVRDIIINRLDDSYHKKVLKETNPIEIIKILRNWRKIENKVNPTSIRTKIYSIKMKPKESVTDFCERFESLIRDYEACENPKK